MKYIPCLLVLVQGLLQIGISLTFGWTIIVIAWSIGHISGGHLNFAVTFAFVLLRKITVLRGIMYFFGQFFGGLVGIGLLKSITPPHMFKVRRVRRGQMGIMAVKFR